MLTAYAEPQNITLIASPEVLAIPIIENHDPMINIKNFQAIVIGPSPEIDNNHDYTFMRKTVFEKLTQAQQLLPKGIHFCLYEGYRSLDLQKILFDNRYKQVVALHPNFNKHELFAETIKLISPVINEDGTPNTPPHATGAAIDVYLIDDNGNALEMGIHPKDWKSDVDGSISLTLSKHISKAAQKNRDIMSHALSEVGFINYPTEYWHWSYGDRYWAHQTKRDHALYDIYIRE